MSAKPHPTPESHPLVFRLARELGSPLSFFDTESTSLAHQQPSFGFTEVAFFSVLPDAKTYAFCSLVNPENPIQAEASRITGITQAMVDPEANFSAIAAKIHRMMEKSIPIGFNSAKFDIPALLNQFDRYGHERPAPSRNVDLRHVWQTAQGTDKGTQSVVAEHYGVPFTGAHRALDDVLALPDVLEQMLWKHGSELFHKSMRHDWDGPAPAAKSGSAPRAPKGELTATQALLKQTIDEALPLNLSIEGYIDALAAKGFELEVTRFGGSRYVLGRGGANPEEKVNGSDLGSDYSWKKIRERLSGELPAALAAAATSNSSEAPQDKGARAAEESRAKDAILAQVKEGLARIDMGRAAADSESQMKTVSFAISNMLADGALQASHVRDDAAQAWLEENWAKLPTDGKLTPLLDACKKAGAPESVDFIQLRVVKATKAVGIAPAPRRPAAPAPQRSAPPQRAAAPAPAAIDYGDAPPFDDVPPFDQDDAPSAARHAP